MSYSVSRKQGWYVLIVETPTHRRKRWYVSLSRAVAAGDRFVRRYGHLAMKVAA